MEEFIASDRKSIAIPTLRSLSGEYNHRIREVFHSVYNEKLWISINEFNEDIENLNGLETPRKVAKLNILTRSMLEYDYSYFSEPFSEMLDEYRPYFYSYIIHMDSQSDIDAYNKLREMGDKWFIASFLKKDSFGEWTEYHGEIESSASPVVYRKHNIYISDEEIDAAIVDEINNTYVIAKPSQDCTVEDIIKLLLNNVRFTSSKVYNVGNGNLINLIGNKKHSKFNVLYDVGYHSRQHPYDKRHTYGSAVRYFKQVNPDVVFLSHWDDDHIMGCVYGSGKLFNCPWIAPEIIKSNAVSARRLAAYLTVKNKLTIVKRNNNARKLVDISTLNSTISFYLGENRSKGNISKENCGGMIIEIKNNTNTKIVESLFCGDVPYEAVETVIWNTRSMGYDNLLVPHHGSKMKCGSLKIKNNATAVVCGNGSPNRPETNHEKALIANGKGYNVLITKDAVQHPWIDLDLG